MENKLYKCNYKILFIIALICNSNQQTLNTINVPITLTSNPTNIVNPYV